MSWSLIVLIVLAVVGFGFFVLTLLKRKWGTILSVIVSIVLSVCGGVSTALVSTDYLVIEIQKDDGDGKDGEDGPQLEITETVTYSYNDDEFRLCIKVINTGPDMAEMCTAMVKNLATGEEDHVWVTEMINPEDFGLVWLAEARMEDTAWKTWLVTPGLADALREGYLITRVSWAHPLPSGTHNFELTVFAQNGPTSREFELYNPEDSAPTLRALD